MCAYSTDRTHIRVCSIVGVFADVIGGFPKWFTFRERKYEGGFANGSLSGTFLERYFVRYFVVSLVG